MSNETTIVKKYVLNADWADASVYPAGSTVFDNGGNSYIIGTTAFASVQDAVKAGAIGSANETTILENIGNTELDITAYENDVQNGALGSNVNLIGKFKATSYTAGNSSYDNPGDVYQTFSGTGTILDVNGTGSGEGVFKPFPRKKAIGGNGGYDTENGTPAAKAIIKFEDGAQGKAASAELANSTTLAIHDARFSVSGNMSVDGVSELGEKTLDVAGKGAVSDWSGISDEVSALPADISTLTGYNLAVGSFSANGLKDEPEYKDTQIAISLSKGAAMAANAVELSGKVATSMTLDNALIKGFKSGTAESKFDLGDSSIPGVEVALSLVNNAKLTTFEKFNHNAGTLSISDSSFGAGIYTIGNSSVDAVISVTGNSVFKVANFVAEDGAVYSFTATLTSATKTDKAMFDIAASTNLSITLKATDDFLAPAGAGAYHKYTLATGAGVSAGNFTLDAALTNAGYQLISSGNNLFLTDLAADMTRIVVDSAYAGKAWGTEIIFDNKPYYYQANAFDNLTDAFNALQNGTKLHAASGTASSQRLSLTKDASLSGEISIPYGFCVAEKADGMGATLTIDEGNSLVLKDGTILIGYDAAAKNVNGNVVVNGDLSVSHIQLRPFGVLTVNSTGSLKQIGNIDINMFNGVFNITGDGTDKISVELDSFSMYDNLGKGSPDTTKGVHYITSVKDANVVTYGSILLGRDAEKALATAGQKGKLEIALDNAVWKLQEGSGTESGNAFVLGSDLKPAGASIYGNFINASTGSKSDTVLTLKNGSVFDAFSYVILGADRTLSAEDSSPFTATSSIFIDANSTLRYGSGGTGGLYIYNSATSVGDDYAGGKISIDADYNKLAGKNFHIWIDGAKSADGVKVLLRDGSDDIADLGKAVVITESNNTDGNWVKIENYRNSFYAFDKTKFDSENLAVTSEAKTAVIGENVAGTYYNGITAADTFADTLSLAGKTWQAGTVTTITVMYQSNESADQTILKGSYLFKSEGATQGAPYQISGKLSLGGATKPEGPISIAFAAGSHFKVGDVYTGWTGEVSAPAIDNGPEVMLTIGETVEGWTKTQGYATSFIAGEFHAGNASKVYLNNVSVSISGLQTAGEMILNQSKLAITGSSAGFKVARGAAFAGGIDAATHRPATPAVFKAMDSEIVFGANVEIGKNDNDRAMMSYGSMELTNSSLTTDSSAKSLFIGGGSELKLSSSTLSAKDITIYAGKPAGSDAGAEPLIAGGKLTLDWKSTIKYSGSLTITGASSEGAHDEALLVIDTSNFNPEPGKEFYLLIDGMNATGGINGNISWDEEDGTGITAKGWTFEKTDGAGHSGKSVFIYSNTLKTGDVAANEAWNSCLYGQEVLLGGKSYYFNLNAYNGWDNAVAAAEERSKADFTPTVHLQANTDYTASASSHTTIQKSMNFVTDGELPGTSAAASVKKALIIDGGSDAITVGIKNGNGTSLMFGDLTLENGATLNIDGKLGLLKTASTNGTLTVNDGTQVKVSATGVLGASAVTIKDTGKMIVTGDGAFGMAANVSASVTLTGSEGKRASLTIQNGAYFAGSIDAQAYSDVTIRQGLFRSTVAGMGIKIAENATLTIQDASEVTADTITIGNNVAVTQSGLSVVTVNNTLTLGEGATYTIDTTSITAAGLEGKNILFLFDGRAATGNIAAITVTGTAPDGWKLVNDTVSGAAGTTKSVYLIKEAEMSTDIVVINSAYAGARYGDAIPMGEKTYLFGINAFDTLPNATALAPKDVKKYFFNVSAPTSTIAFGADFKPGEAYTGSSFAGMIDAKTTVSGGAVLNIATGDELRFGQAMTLSGEGSKIALAENAAMESYSNGTLEINDGASITVANGAKLILSQTFTMKGGSVKIANGGIADFKNLVINAGSGTAAIEQSGNAKVTFDGYTKTDGTLTYKIDLTGFVKSEKDADVLVDFSGITNAATISTLEAFFNTNGVIINLPAEGNIKAAAVNGRVFAGTVSQDLALVSAGTVPADEKVLGWSAFDKLDEAVKVMENTNLFTAETKDFNLTFADGTSVTGMGTSVSLTKNLTFKAAGENGGTLNVAGDIKTTGNAIVSDGAFLSLTGDFSAAAITLNGILSANKTSITDTDAALTIAKAGARLVQTSKNTVFGGNIILDSSAWETDSIYLIVNATAYAGSALALESYTGTKTDSATEKGTFVVYNNSLYLKKGTLKAVVVDNKYTDIAAAANEGLAYGVNAFGTANLGTWLSGTPPVANMTLNISSFGTAEASADIAPGNNNLVITGAVFGNITGSTVSTAGAVPVITLKSAGSVSGNITGSQDGESKNLSKFVIDSTSTAGTVTGKIDKMNSVDVNAATSFKGAVNADTINVTAQGTVFKTLTAKTVNLTVTGSPNPSTPFLTVTDSLVFGGTSPDKLALNITVDTSADGFSGLILLQAYEGFDFSTITVKVGDTVITDFGRPGASPEPTMVGGYTFELKNNGLVMFKTNNEQNFAVDATWDGTAFGTEVTVGTGPDAKTYTFGKDAFATLDAVLSLRDPFKAASISIQSGTALDYTVISPKFTSSQSVDNLTIYGDLMTSTGTIERNDWIGALTVKGAVSALNYTAVAGTTGNPMVNATTINMDTAGQYTAGINLRADTLNISNNADLNIAAGKTVYAKNVNFSGGTAADPIVLTTGKDNGLIKVNANSVLNFADNTTVEATTDQLEEFLNAGTIHIGTGVSLTVTGGEINDALKQKFTDAFGDAVKYRGVTLQNAFPIDDTTVIEEGIGEVLGTVANDTMTVGYEKTLTLGYNVNMLGGYNSVLVNVNAVMSLAAGKTAADVKNVSVINVLGGAMVYQNGAFVQKTGIFNVGTGTIETSNGYASIYVGNYAKFTSGGIAASDLGGSIAITVGLNSEMKAQGAIQDVANLITYGGTGMITTDGVGNTISGVAKFETDSITGLNSANTVSFGANSDVKIGKYDTAGAYVSGGKIDLKASYNTLTVGSNSKFHSGAITNVASLTIVAGSIRQPNQAEVKLLQDRTKATINSDVTLSDVSGLVNIGGFSDVKIGGDLKATASGTYGSTILVGTNSNVEIAGDLTGAAYLNVVQGTSHYNYHTDPYMLQDRTKFTVKGNLSGLDSADSVSFGGFSDVEIGTYSHDANGKVTGWISGGAFDLKGGYDTLIIGSNSTFNSGAVSNVYNFVISAGYAHGEKTTDTVFKQDRTEVKIHGDYAAAPVENLINIGAFSDVEITGKIINSIDTGSIITVGSNSTFTTGGAVNNVSSLTILPGSIYKELTSDTAFTQGKTAVSIGGAITGTTFANAVHLGGNASLNVTGSVDLKGGANSVTIIGGAALTIYGSLSNVQTFTVSPALYDDPTKIDIKGDYTGSTGIGVFSTGNFTSLKITGSIASPALGGSYSMTFGANSETKIGTYSSEEVLLAGGDIDSVANLTVLGGNAYYDSTFTAIQGRTTFTAGEITGADGAHTVVNIGAYTVFKSGNIDLGEGYDQILIGGNTDFSAGAINGAFNLNIGSGIARWDAAEGKLFQGKTKAVINGDYTAETAISGSITIGMYADLDIMGNVVIGANSSTSVTILANGSMTVDGDINNVNLLNVLAGSGVAYTPESGSMEIGVTKFTANNFSGTAGNDNFITGANSEVNINGNLDFGGGDYDTMNLGANSWTRIGGNVENLETAIIGAGATVVGHADALNAIKATTGYKADDVTWIDLDDEVSDNTLAQSSASHIEHEDGYKGWLSSQDDTADFFAIEPTNAAELSGWKVQGDRGALVVKVYQSDDNGSSWDTGTEVTGTTLTWDLSTVSIKDETNMLAISVELASGSEGIRTYKFGKLA